MENDNNQNVDNVTEPVQEITLEPSTSAVTEPVQEITLEPSTAVETDPVQEPSTAVVTEPSTEAQVQVIVQEQSTEVPKKKKMDKNTLVRLIAVGIIVIGIAIYLLFFHKWSFSVNESNPKSVIEGYFSRIEGKDYSRAYDLVYIPDNAIVELDDFLTFISSSKDLKKVSKITESEKTKTTATYDVEFSDTGKKYKYNLNLISTGEWKVVIDDLYIDGWKVEIPGESNLYIEDTIVSSILSKKEGNHDIYTLTIAPGNKKFKIETDLGNYSTKIDVAGSNSGEKIIPELEKEEELNSTLTAIKDIWNNMYKDYTKSVSKEDILKKYFDSNFKVEDIEKYYPKGFDTMTKKGNKNNTFTNLELVNTVKNVNKKTTIEADDIIKLEFGYKINFLVDYAYVGSKDLDKSMTRFSSIKLKKTGSGYKINEITDDKLFSFLSYTYVDF